MSLYFYQLSATRASGLNPGAFLGASPRWLLDAVGQFLDARLLRAVGAAEEAAVARLQAVADDRHAAVVAARGELVDGALERIERVRLTVLRDLERLVVVVAAAVAGSHGVRLPGGVTAHAGFRRAPGGSGRSPSGCRT